MRKILETVLLGFGVASFLFGIRSFRNDPPPKPTEEDQVTRVDYLSGRYQEALEDREETIESQRKRGGWIIGAGVLFILAGLGCLLASVRPSSEELENSNRSSNGHAKTRKEVQSGP